MVSSGKGQDKTVKKSSVAVKDKEKAPSKGASAKATPKQKIRIRLKSFDHRLIDQSAERIVDTASRSGAFVMGPVPLPTKRKVFCVLKSPHVDKRGGEHFQVLIHMRLIEISDPPPTTIDALTSLDLPSGVDIELKII